MLHDVLRSFRRRATPPGGTPPPPSRDQHIRQLIDASPVPMALISATGTIEYLNRQFIETFGYSHAELPHLDAWWPRAYPNVDRTKLQREWCERMLDVAGKGGQLAPHETEVTCRDGTVRTIEWRAAHIAQLTLVVGMDLTERLNASRALAASEERYRALLEHAPEPVVVFDVNTGRFAEANPAAQRLFKLTREQLVQVGPADLSPAVQPDGRSSAEAAMAYLQAALDGQRPTFEWLHHDSEGRELPCEIQIIRLPDLGGRRLVRGSITDVRERKQAEETRKRLETQLRQAQKMEAIGTLAGGIAHDFNNILTGILGSVELAEYELADRHPAGPLLKRAVKACLRARDLVGKILTFSRRGEVQRNPVALGPLVREAAELLRATLPATIEMKTLVTGDPLTILCDPGQIQQVVMNLGANAAYAMRGRGGTLTITLESWVIDPGFARGHPSFPPGIAAVLTISDTGAGMDAATRERMFEPFFTTKPPGEGTGLGLAVVHGIVEDHGGIIAVDSGPGLGTTFRIYFPVAANAAPAGSASPFDLPRGGGQRLLFVDDESDVTAVASRALAKLGYSATSFTHPAEALAAFRRNPAGFDALVTDLTMPEMTGADLVAEIRRVRPDLPVLVLTGYLRGMEYERIHALGITQFLDKPFTLLSLGDAVRKLFTGTTESPARELR